MEVVLDDNGVLEYTKVDIPKLATSDAQQLSLWKKDTMRARRIILKGARDHIVSNLHGKETPFAMWKTVTELFENNSDAKKLGLMIKLRIEDKGYDVVLRNGKAYLNCFASGQVRQIGVRIESLCKLEEDACATLRSKVDIPQSIDVVVEQEQDRALKMAPSSSKGEIAAIPLRVRWVDVEP